MKRYQDPFESPAVRSRALGVLAAAALACVMLSALSLKIAEPPVPEAEPAPAATPAAQADTRTADAG